MATEIIMPKLGLTMEEGTVLKWLKHEGDHIEKGESVLQIQTDKVEYEVESPTEGVLHRTLAEEGQVIPCGEVVGVIGGADEEIDLEKVKAKARVAPASPPRVEPKKEEPPRVEAPPAEVPAPGERVKISPAARKLAKEMGVDISKLRGTGPGGRIVKEDILAATPAEAAPAEAVPVEAPPPGPVLESIPLKGVRAVIVRRMGQSWHEVARVTEVVEADVTGLQALREANKEAWESEFGLKVSINDLILFYTSRAIKQFPRVNARLEGEEIQVLSDINLGVAVDTEAGLVVPVIRNADRKSVEQIAREAHALAEKAQKGTLDLDELEGGTFTVTNLGGLGIEIFTPIVNFPQCAILGVGRAAPRPAVVEGEVRVRSMMYLSLSFDHRVIDGAPAAQFLKVLKDILEHPRVMPA